MILCIHHWFELQAAQVPDKLAIRDDHTQLTYHELNVKANRLAHYLIGAGVKANTMVGLYVDRSVNSVIAILGILKAGGAYLPFDPFYPTERIKFMLDDAQIPLLITESEYRYKIPENTARIICIEDIFLATNRDTFYLNPTIVVQGNNLAYVIYTSGSTGKPKGTLVSHWNVIRLFQSTEHWYHFNKNDVWTLFHSIAFDFSVWEIWGALFYGGLLIVVPYPTTRSPRVFYELLLDHKVTVLNQTPSAFLQLIKAEEEIGIKNLTLLYVIFGGEALQLGSLQPWFDRHGDTRPLLINMYGITETTVHVTYRPLSKNDLGSGSIIGREIPDLKIHILDREGKEVPAGAEGEIFVSGPGVAQGYLNRPELTAKRFLPDRFNKNSNGRLYRTGDLARRLPHDDIEYLGRIDHQVKIRGFRIELGEIETILCIHDQIRESVVLARDDLGADKQLVAYIVYLSYKPPVAELRTVLKQYLPDYMVPAQFIFLDKFPLNENGKIDRRRLPKPIWNQASSGVEFILPSNDIERQIISDWECVLGVSGIGIQDNFFDIGGSSLLVQELYLKLENTFERSLPAETIFQYPTVADLANYFSNTSTPNKLNNEHVNRMAKQRTALARRRKKIPKRSRG